MYQQGDLGYKERFTEALRVSLQKVKKMRIAPNAPAVRICDILERTPQKREVWRLVGAELNETPQRIYKYYLNSLVRECYHDHLTIEDKFWIWEWISAHQDRDARWMIQRIRQHFIGRNIFPGDIGSCFCTTRYKIA